MEVQLHPDSEADSAKQELCHLLEELAGTVKDGSLCGLGKTAPNPILTTLRYFRDEYEAHLETVRISARYFPIIELSGVVGIAVLVGFGGLLVDREVVTVGTVLALVLYLNNLFREESTSPQVVLLTFGGNDLGFAEIAHLGMAQVESD